MLSTQDIKTITEITETQIKGLKTFLRTFLSANFYTKEELDEKFLTKTEFNEKFSALQSAVDGIAKHDIAHERELAVAHYQTTRLEDWAKPAGEKIGLRF